MKLLERTTKSSRVAVYDSVAVPPRLINLEAGSWADLIERLATTTYRECQNKGASFPYVVLREVVENLIHANFQEIVVSIFDSGRTVRVSDQGPGILDKTRALEPGYTTATSQMKKYIRGVGSGLPIVKEMMTFSGGRVEVQDNLGSGTVITLCLTRSSRDREPAPPVLTKRQISILSLVTELGSAGPTDVNRELGISLSTIHREFLNMEEIGLLKSDSQGKRCCTNKGFDCLNSTMTSIGDSL